ncbi:hypothetical protein FA95DRAFT_408526 [Auriscalpium vulgare]|uniref:Uncharacterized protein n=1 Tax=Auriscalpium vulgare TaxID=40419 RepID=A0ACB8RGX7_9AGAM|nr:hypothetical protein FA95DRAFT_408526 [Auriscalpium vulgare]
MHGGYKAPRNVLPAGDASQKWIHAWARSSAMRCARLSADRDESRHVRWNWASHGAR